MPSPVDSSESRLRFESMSQPCCPAAPMPSLRVSSRLGGASSPSPSEVSATCAARKVHVDEEMGAKVGQWGWTARDVGVSAAVKSATRARARLRSNTFKGERECARTYPKITPHLTRGPQRRPLILLLLGKA